MLWRFVALFALSAVVGGGASAVPSAVNLLFETPHLADLQSGTTLSYAFRHQAQEEALGTNFDDAIEVMLSAAGEAGTFVAHVDLFTGERHRRAGPFSNMTGNPIIMIFLEHDVLEMNRHLEGNDFYLRNRIKEALAAATAEPFALTFEGVAVSGWKIILEPFVNERDKPRLNRFADKRYEIVLADAVPGDVYQMRTTTPGTNGAELVSNVLTFDEISASGSETHR